MEEKIKRHSRVVPFGYKLDETEEYLEPITGQLDALNQAKEYINTCSYREVAQWLHKKTGRYISHVGLKQRLTRDSTSETKTNSSQESESIN